MCEKIPYFTTMDTFIEVTQMLCTGAQLTTFKHIDSSGFVSTGGSTHLRPNDLTEPLVIRVDVLGSDHHLVLEQIGDHRRIRRQFHEAAVLEVSCLKFCDTYSMGP